MWDRLVHLSGDDDKVTIALTAAIPTELTQLAHRFVEHATVGTSLCGLVGQALNEAACGAEPDLLGTVVVNRELPPRHAVFHARLVQGLVDGPEFPR